MKCNECNVHYKHLFKIEELKKIQKKLENCKKQGRNPQANNNSTSLQPSENNVTDSDAKVEAEYNTRVKAMFQEKKASFGFACNNIQASTLPLLKEDTLPNWEDLEKTKNKKDKTCQKCG